MRIGIVVAIKEEADFLANRLGLTLQSISTGSYNQYFGDDIIMLTPGQDRAFKQSDGNPVGRPGKVSAGVITTILIEQFDPNIIINCGTAAAVAAKDIHVGDVVVADYVANHDIYIPLIGYEEYGKRKISFNDLDIFANIALPYKKGTVSSSESFITTKEGWDLIHKNDVSVIEMEAAGVIQAVEILNYINPVFIVKSITGLESEASTDTQVTNDFERNFNIAMNNLAEFIEKAISIIKGKYQALPKKNMDARFELFVDDIDRSVAFYRDIMRFKEMTSYGNYHPMHRGAIKIGIGAGEKLSNHHYFRPEVVNNIRKGIGVEFVLEVDDIEEEYKFIQSKQYPIAENLNKQEWGLTDFRIVDPDGYYLRITSKI